MTTEKVNREFREAYFRKREYLRWSGRFYKASLGAAGQLWQKEAGQDCLQKEALPLLEEKTRDIWYVQSITGTERLLKAVEKHFGKEPYQLIYERFINDCTQEDVAYKMNCTRRVLQYREFRLLIDLFRREGGNEDR